MPFAATPITLDDKTRAELESRVAAHTTPQRDAKRARIILLAAQGVSSAQISLRVGLHESNVAMWRRRFLAEGIEGLKDAKRSGRPRTYGHDQLLKMAAIATTIREKPDGRQTWTYQELAEELKDDVGVSVAHLHRTLRGLDIRPHLVKGWLNRKDTPDFWERVEDICGLYLSKPDNAVVYSIDEKTGIQATERKHPTTPAGQSRAVRREFEYVRHGTASLMSAFEVHTGAVHASPIARNDSVTFCEFLEEIDRVVDDGLTIHVILDNGSSHTAKNTRAWLDAHPRFVTHFTPPHASWVNQVELFFSILTRKVLRNNSFSSKDDLVAKIMAFIAEYNTTAIPFKWTYSGQPLKAA